MHSEQHTHGPDPDKGPDVTIQVDGHPRTIHRGRQTVAEIKRVGQVPAAYDLEQVVAGEMTLLADDGSVTIKGDEVFVSHPKGGTSS